MASGIYQILNVENGKRYIGSAVDFQERKWKHFSELRKNTHGNRKLQRAYNKYGAEAFAMEPIITCAKSMLIWYEQQFLDQLQPEYNICKRAGSPVGTTNTPEGKASQIAKQSKSLTHNGETHTYREWDVIVGLAPGGIRRRVHAFGASSEKLFVPPSELWEAQKPLMGGDHWSGKTMSIEHKQKMGISQKYRREQEATRYTHAGKTLTPQQWDKELGLAPDGFAQRLRLGKKENLFAKKRSSTPRTRVSDLQHSTLITNENVVDNQNQKKEKS